MVFFQLAGMTIMEKSFWILKTKKLFRNEMSKYSPLIIGLKPSFLVHTSYLCSKFPARADVCTRLVSTFCTENKTSTQEDPKPVAINFEVLVSCTLKFIAEEMIYRETSVFLYRIYLLNRNIHIVE